MGELRLGGIFTDQVYPTFSQASLSCEDVSASVSDIGYTSGTSVHKHHVPHSKTMS
jgi:hypothetical protein